MIRRARVGVAGVAALVAVLTACTATVESSSPGTRAPGTSASTTTTIGNYGSSVTTAPSTTSPPLDASDLERLLPGLDEIGEGYLPEPPLDGPDGDASTDEAWDEAARDACPELVELSSDYSGVFTIALAAEPAQAFRAFTDGFGRRVIVSITDGADDLLDGDQLEKLISAINSCETIRFTNVQGLDVALKMQAQPDSRYGDLGVVMSMDQDLSGGLLPRMIEMAGRVRMFQSGSVTVAITTVDGIDPETFRKVSVDHRLAANLAERLDADIADLHGA